MKKLKNVYQEPQIFDLGCPQGFLLCQSQKSTFDTTMDIYVIEDAGF